MSKLIGAMDKSIKLFIGACELVEIIFELFDK